ncbi:ABC transporter ATP-binding protein [Tritonibacter mobilis]|uniref:ABC transporter ATP-binding protein n=1 Tax=Tritonibacter mobilis TaxID=379347 RepID=UPI003A5C3DC0
MSFLEITSLSARVGPVPILRNVSLNVAAGEVRALVGESGAGKSMIGKAILGTLPGAIRITGGEIRLDGQNLLALRPAERRRVIGQTAALIPQDPLTALNPVRRIGPQITRRLVDILGWSKRDAEARALDLLAEVHIPDPKRVMQSYPHELSGGMRQRVLIASAFAAEPKLIIADEPTTALDVTVQKQILRLIKEMQERHNTALLFVTHDLGVVAKICQNLTVLFGGKVLEEAAVEAFFAAPQHPYSRALLAATPKYTDPDQNLTPVPQRIIDDLQAELRFAERTTT